MGNDRKRKSESGEDRRKRILKRCKFLKSKNNFATYESVLSAAQVI
jgi:hypothetical protein